MKTQEQIEKMLEQYQAEYENLKPQYEESKSWFDSDKFMKADYNQVRATSKAYTELCDRMCKFAGAIAVLKIILDGSQPKS